MGDGEGVTEVKTEPRDLRPRERARADLTFVIADREESLVVVVVMVGRLSSVLVAAVVVFRRRWGESAVARRFIVAMVKGEGGELWECGREATPESGAGIVAARVRGRKNRKRGRRLTMGMRVANSE